MSASILNNTVLLGRFACRPSIFRQSLINTNRTFSSKNRVSQPFTNYTKIQRFNPQISISSSSSSHSPSSILQSISITRQNALRRTFHTQSTSLIRQTYFPRGSNGSNNRPPSQSFFRTLRRRIDRLPIMTVIYGLIGLNIAIYLLWQYAMTSYQRFRDPIWLQFLYNNFVLNEGNIMNGRIWTLLTACFSHSTGSHILVNCLGLYFVAPAAAS